MAGVSSRAIAENAGVSPATVSRVLSGRGYASEETRNTVYEAARKLGVELSSLRKRSGNIAFVMRRAKSEPCAANPFYSKVLRGAEEEASSLGYGMLYVTVDEDILAAGELPPPLKAQQADAILVVGLLSAEAMNVLVGCGLPLVQLDAVARPGIPCILTDNACGASQAVEHLIATYGNDVVCFGYEGQHASSSFDERVAGYRGAFGRLGLAPPAQEYVHLTSTEGYSLAESVFSERLPRAVFCANDKLAIDVLRWANENGISVPSQLAVIGFDNIDAAASVYPTLSTVHVHKELMGAEGVAHLARLLGGRPVPPAVIMPAQLVMRNSA